MLNSTEIFLIFLAAICFLACLAQRIKLSYPIACVLGGIGLASIPGFPEFNIPPHMMLLLFLPILLTESAYFTSLREFKRNFRSIFSMAFGLVIFTAIATAFVFKELVPGGSWATGFVLGAIISPPDAVAATSILRNVNVPKRVISILEGESLVNDATGLVIYKFAVAAVVTGYFSLQQASIDFIWMLFSGIAIGMLLAHLYCMIFKYIKEPSVEILSTFLLPFAAYIITEEVHGSGVMAVVCSGIVTSWKSVKFFTPSFRIPAMAVWRMVIFILNGLVFLLIGLHFPDLLQSLSNYNLPLLVFYGTAISAVAIAVRFLWIYAMGYGQVYALRRLVRKSRYPAWQNVFIASWSGMRGVVSLATALALPLTIAGGAAFPQRELIIFLAFSVIMVTLVLQGITLPLLVRKLNLRFDDTELYENWRVRKEAAESALSKLDEISRECGAGSQALERIRGYYIDRVTSLGDGPNTQLRRGRPQLAAHPIIEEENKIWHEALEVERQVILLRRQQFEINDDVMHEVLGEIDLLYNRFAQ